VELDLEAAGARIRYSSATQQSEYDGGSPTGTTATGSPSAARTPAGAQVPHPRRTNGSRKTGSTRRSRQERASEGRSGADARDQPEDSAA